MSKDVIKETSLLFEEKVRLTEVKEYGFNFKNFAEGTLPVPSSGLQFDIHFEGKVSGDTINGTIKGVDYLTVRADGRLFLDLHAVIETIDGARIKVTEHGINDQGTLRLNMDFHTNDERYDWLNKKHVWGIGNVDFKTGNVFIQGYQHQ